MSQGAEEGDQRPALAGAELGVVAHGARRVAQQLVEVRVAMCNFPTVPSGGLGGVGGSLEPPCAAAAHANDHLEQHERKQRERDVR